MMYRVRSEYLEAPDHPIEIKQGEVLEFVEESDAEGDWANWVYCKGVNKEGWVPKQILEINNNNILVLKNYSAKEHNLTTGEILHAEYELNGWIWCEKEGSRGLCAWAPLNHLVKI
ncbi:conserved protein of unknown function [Pseudodesulfovibrio profundus]|uniref:SH3 domain-containing protein n=1 Tax=Pseudodesulfovibrio profundus TaxID=57320 RepID=A0A2C8F5L1_9BACT|nr:SH3 domain-containing protein [Pseudodesulfovibrio profundus]SOB57311.1 conserved protein of unknown function [Pseudodesulfovibrio profundus]